MKNYTIIFLILFLGKVCFAQNINKIEYFVDADPGFGSGTDVPIAAASPVTANFNVSIASVADGFHFLSVRAKDINDQWGIVAVRPFYKETVASPPTGTPNIVAMEYFIDADPGFGAATALTVSPGSPLSQSFTVPLSSVTDGFHFLSVRAKDENNKWSIVAVRPFYKETIASPPSAAPNIVAMEYFIDADPGFGAATALTVSLGSPLSQSFTLSLTSITDGFHFLSVRAKDANNKWSIVAVRPFYKETIASPPAAVPNIVAMEYFIDADPGFGAATALSFTAVSPISKSFSVNLGTLANGTHRLSIRAKDANNNWSIVGIKDFVVRDNVVVTGLASNFGWCTNTSFNVPFTTSGTYNSGNVFTLQLSDASGSFSSGTINLGTLSGTNSGTIIATIPSTVSIGNSYKVRIVSSNPAINDNPEIPFSVLAVCPPPCSMSITLASPNNDASSGAVSHQAGSGAGGLITATNKLTGTVNATYQARAIILDQGFYAANGVVFLAEVGGCN